MTEQKPTLLSSQLAKTPSPEMQRKVKQMIRKKASLYGINELVNPTINPKHILLFASKLTNKNIRSKSSLTNVPSTKALKSAREHTAVDEYGDPIVKAPVVPSYKLDSKTNQERIFPPLSNLWNLIENERQVMYTFRDKLDYDLNDVVYEYLKILELAIAHEADVFANKITLQKGVLIPTLQFLAESLLECQFVKIVLVFAVIGLNLCEFYKQLDRVGKFLFIISKVLRKMEKYEECQLTLKKSLEYVWYARAQCNSVSEDKFHKELDKSNLQQQKDNKDDSMQNKQHKKHRRNRSNMSEQRSNNPKTTQKQPQLKSIPTTNMQSSLNSEFQYPSKKYQKPGESYQETHRLKQLEEEYTTTELEIYNELSYCLLQLNKKEESKVFGEKYEIGYLEKDGNSSVMALSKDLISSAQKRIIAWQRVDKRRFYLVFGIELDKYLIKYGQTIKDKFQQTKFIKALKVNIELLIDNLFKKDIFFYEVPLITEIKDDELQQYKKSHNKLPALTQRFVYKKKSLTEGVRSGSIPGDLKRFKNENVGGNKIFNYRGVGLSRTKLSNLFREYIRFLEIKLGTSNKQITNKLPPVTSHIKSETKNHDENHQYGK